MKKIISLLSFLLIFVSYSFAQKDPCTCNETTPKENQNRTKAKHVTNYGSFSKAKYDIVPEDIITWQDQYSTYTRDIKKGTDRVNDTPEDSLYTLHGYMYFLKQEANDCDFHIEIGPKSIKSKRRVIVEVSKENCDLQKEILTYIKSKGFKKNKQFTKGLKCTVVGLGFYDAAHKPNRHGGIFTHKSSWELHPVKSIKFE
jgi:hypothetical protein